MTSVERSIHDPSGLMMEDEDGNNDDKKRVEIYCENKRKGEISDSGLTTFN